VFGLTLEEAMSGAGDIELWPDNERTVMAFEAMRTQWRVGMNGPIGLDYSALPPVLRMTDVPRREWPQVFEGIRLMEDAALDHMTRSRKKHG
jgi:hypothetical protein